MNLSRKNLARWSRIGGAFAVGQGSSQILQLLTGFLIINWLSKDQYATFALVIAIQSVAAMLVDLGVSQPITALIGKRIGDPPLVGRIVAASRFFRDRFLLVGALALFAVFFLLADRYHWDRGLWLVLWLATALTLVFQSWSGTYASILLLKQALGTLYKIDVASAAIRLGLIAVAHFAGVLSAPLALAFGALQALAAGWSTIAATRPDRRKPPPDDPLRGEKSKILKLSLPRVPSLLFFSFEGQITIFLIGYYGTTAEIAEIGALGRLGMLFLIFRKSGNAIIAPYFAKLERFQVASRVRLLAAAATAFCLAVAATAHLFPHAFLWILGDGYQHLAYPVFLALTAGGLRLMGVLLFSVIMARKYIYPWISLADILPQLAVMVLGIALFDLSTLNAVLHFGLALAFTKTLTKAAILLHGLRLETRRTHD